MPPQAREQKRPRELSQTSSAKLVVAEVAAGESAKRVGSVTEEVTFKVRISFVRDLDAFSRTSLRFSPAFRHIIALEYSTFLQGRIGVVVFPGRKLGWEQPSAPFGLDSDDTQLGHTSPVSGQRPTCISSCGTST